MRQPLHAREKAAEMGQLVISSTRLSVLLLVLTGIPLLIYAAPILRLWIGPQYVKSGAPLLAILIVANFIRLIGAPYSIILVAAGQQNFIKISPLAEGASNFVASALMGMLFGGIGVAFGTLFGAVVGMGTHLRYSMPRTKDAINLSRQDFLISGVLFSFALHFPAVSDRGGFGRRHCSAHASHGLGYTAFSRGFWISRGTGEGYLWQPIELPNRGKLIYLNTFSRIWRED